MACEGDIIKGRYRIVTTIGRGGMSTVYLALDTTLNKQWAIKEFRDVSDPSRRRIVVRSLTREANLIKGFDHPSIPRIVDFIEQDGNLFVVMDYVEGVTLREKMHEAGVRDERDVVDWGIQLCGVLDYLHRREEPIVYADLKPSNVMLKPDGTIMLIDFGIAHQVTRSRGDEGGDGEVLGTPGYGAPEQFDEGRVVDVRSDVYALGVTLHTLLTSVDPVREHKPIRQYRPELSEGLERVLETAMSNDPDRRYQTCAQMAYALRHYAEEDRKSRDALVVKWRAFVSLVVAACMCILLAGTFLMVEQVVRSNDYGHWMALARQATDDGVAERYFIKASGIRRDAIEPYEGLMERYKADGRFDDREERQYSQAIEDNLGSLQGDGRRWAELSYQTGLLYWFYYEADVSARVPGVQDDAVQYARIRSAAAWMRNAAAVKGWNGAETAGIYADIADFSLQVVPRIQQGLDAGLYKGYFSRLGQLVDVAEKSSNEVIRLNVAHLVQGALSVYPRKFRADGVGRQSLEELAQRVERMAVGTDTTSALTDVMRQTVLEGAGSAMDDIAHAFVDARKVE